MNQAILSSYGFIHRRGFGGKDRSVEKHSSEKGLIKWRIVSDNPCSRFGRLDPLSKYTLIAVEMLNLPALSNDPYSDTAILLGTGYGSISVDMDFYHTVKAGMASPRLFTYTLPNIAMAEVAIRHRIRGMNLCLMAGRKSGLLALWKGAKLIEWGEVSSCVCIGADFLTEKAIGVSEKIPFDAPLSGFAWAFFLEKETNKEEQILSPLARISTGSIGEKACEENWDELSALCDFLMAPEIANSPLCLGLDSLGIRESLEVDVLSIKIS